MLRPFGLPDKVAPFAGLWRGDEGLRICRDRHFGAAFAWAAAFFAAPA
jgi:hypothetical protein